MPTQEGNAPPWPRLRKLVRQTLQSPALGNEVTKNPHERIRFARRIGLSGDRTEYRVK